MCFRKFLYCGLYNPQLLSKKIYFAVYTICNSESAGKMVTDYTTRNAFQKKY